jgi:hypothetical protein
MTTQQENVRVLVALTNLLLCQLAELRRLRASSQAASNPLNQLLDEIIRSHEQAEDQLKHRLSRTLAEAGYPSPTATVTGPAKPRRGVDQPPQVRGFH